MKTENVTLAILGVGNMGEALCRGIVGAGVVAPERVTVADTAAERVKALAKDLGVVAAATNRQAVERSAVVIVAVKPKDVDPVMDDVGPLLTRERLLVSIAAGVRIATYEAKMPPVGRVVRAMPNTPMMVGLGAVGLAGGSNATTDDLEMAAALFRPSALVVVLKDEALLDAVTAVSGSGPAYFFYLVEAMVEAGVAEGLSEPDALALARQTALGAATLLAKSGERPEALRRRVTSPGGTTQAAIERIEAGHVREHLVAAVRRAAERAREMGR